MKNIKSFGSKYSNTVDMLNEIKSKERNQFSNANAVQDISSLVKRSLGLETSCKSSASSNFHGIASKNVNNSEMLLVFDQRSNRYNTSVCCNEPSDKINCEVTESINSDNGKKIKSFSQFWESTNDEHFSDSEQNSENDSNMECFLSRNLESSLPEKIYSSEPNDYNNFSSFLIENDTNSTDGVSYMYTETFLTTSIPLTNQNDSNELLSTFTPQCISQSDLKCIQEHENQDLLEISAATVPEVEVNNISTFTRSICDFGDDELNLEYLDSKKQFDEHISSSSVTETKEMLESVSHEKAVKSDKFARLSSSKHDRENKKYSCPHCIKSFRLSSSLKRHIRSHNTSNTHQDDESIKYLASVSITKENSNFDSDDLSKTEPSKEKEALRCPQCSMNFKFTSKLKRHMKTHVGSKPYTCHICTKGFLERFNLMAHVQIHSKEKPYVCNICKKAFSFKSNLTRHIKCHKKVKSFICNECGNEYNSEKKLTSHVRIHQEKPHECVLCGTGFKKKSNLFRHAKIHSSEIVFPCNICEYKARLNFHLNRHMQINHGK